MAFGSVPETAVINKSLSTDNQIEIRVVIKNKSRHSDKMIQQRLSHWPHQISNVSLELGIGS